MKKIIISMQGCQRCQSLKAMVPNTECLTLDPMEFLPFCRAVGIQTMPFVVMIGEPQELAKELKE